MDLKKLDFLSIKARKKLVSSTLSFTLGFSIIVPNIAVAPNIIGISTTTVKAFADEVTQTDIKKVVGISNDIFILKSDGTIYKNDLSESNKLDISNVKDIVFGERNYSASCVFFITNDGNVYAYGKNDHGQLGLGDTNDRNIPVKVDITDVKTVVTGIYENTYFLKNDGTVFSCGSDLNLSSNEPGLLYANITKGVYYSSTTVQVNITDVEDIVSSGGQMFFLKSDGSVPGYFSTGVKKIISSNSNTNNGNDNSVFFIMSDDTVYVYGKNGSGQLGTGDILDKKSPTLISLNNVKDIMTSVGIAYGEGCKSIGRTYFLKNDGSVYTCGDTNNSTIPEEVSGISEISQMIKISMPIDGNYPYFVKNDGSLLYDNSGLISPIKDKKGNEFNISEFKNIGYDGLISTEKGIFLDKNNVLYFCYWDNVNEMFSIEVDKTAPMISVNGNPTSWQNTDATINVTATDETGGSGVANITLPDGTVVNGSNTSFKATQNGTYTVKAADNAGNVSTQTVTISKIDKTAPTVPTISNNNGTVTITPGTDLDSGVEETVYSIDGGVYQKYTVPFALDTGNHTVKSKTLDNAGNSSTEVSDNITVEDTALKNATAAVANAESTVSQADVDSAKGLVDALPNSQSKTDLENRLRAVQDKINQLAQQAQAVKDATDAVNKAQQSQNQSDLDNAKEIVLKLPEGADKTNLENQIDSIQDSINKKKADGQAAQDLAKASAAVQRAEITGRQADVDSAKSLVDALPDSQSKTDLENRLQAIQDKIDSDNAAIKKVEDALSKANSTLAQDDITAAQEAINELPTGIDRVQYNNQLRIIQQKVQIATAVNINKANAAVTKVSRTKSITDLNTARNLINALPNCTQKTKLNAQLDIIQRFCK